MYVWTFPLPSPRIPVALDPCINKLNLQNLLENECWSVLESVLYLDSIDPGSVG